MIDYLYMQMKIGLTASEYIFPCKELANKCMKINMFYLYMSLQPSIGPRSRFQFLDLLRSWYDSLARGISPSQSRYLHAEQHKQNKYTQISTSQVGFESTIPVFERAKTVHTLHRAATLIGITLS
jgi:hypothetical protein